MPHTRPARATLEKTIERQSVALDARSVVALEWLQAWATRHASLHCPPAIIVRRALVLLADYISGLDPHEIAGEGHRLREAAKGAGSAVTLTEARARLERHVETYRGPSAPGCQPLDHWHDMLHSIEERKESRAMLAKLESLMADWPEEATA